MAHLDTRLHRTQADHARVCAAARTWHALAITAVALMVVAPALVVGVLLLVEAVLPQTKPETVAQSRVGPAPSVRTSVAPLR
jgi:hypothetical protein